MYTQILRNIKLRQNDVPPAYYSYKTRKNEHCFSMTIFVCAAVAAGIEQPTIKQYLDCYVKANEAGILSDEDSPDFFGAYVKSDRRLGNLVLKHFGSNKKLIRAGRLDGKTAEMPNADFIIINGKTERGNGHFREFRYDPWSPEITFRYFKSIRYYIVR